MRALYSTYRDRAELAYLTLGGKRITSTHSGSFYVSRAQSCQVVLDRRSGIPSIPVRRVFLMLGNIPMGEPKNEKKGIVAIKDC